MGNKTSTVRPLKQPPKMQTFVAIEDSNATPDRPSLCIIKYYQWFDALRKEDAAEAEKILAGKASEKWNMLHGAFFYDNAENATLNLDIPLKHRLTLPLHVAIVSNSRNVIKWLLNQGVKPSAVDSRGNNAFHALAFATFINPARDGEYAELYTWLRHEVGEEETKKMLMAENSECFRPVEYAAHFGVIRLTSAIYETEGVYKIKEGDYGFTHYAWYDVTEYEDGRRNFTSPLDLVVFGDRRMLKYVADDDVRSYPMFPLWGTGKISINRIPLILWFLYRLTAVVLYFLLSMDAHDLTEEHEPSTYCSGLTGVVMERDLYWTLAWLTYISFVLNFLFDIGEFAYYRLNRNERARFRIMDKGKDPPLTFFTFRITHFILCVLIIIVFPVSTANTRDNATMALVAHILFVAIPIAAVWSILFFFQFLPSIGHSIISIQSMLKSLFHFMFIFILLICPFAIALAEYYQLYVNECQEDFKDFFRSGYTVFRLMLNMYDFTSVKVENPGILFSLHIFYVFLVAVLLLNFLIAQMSYVADSTAHVRELSFLRNRMAAAIVVEKRLFWLFKKLYMMKKRSVFEIDDEGRICVVVQTCTMQR